MFKLAEEKKIPDINIGLVGHVDHGKTTLTEALTGKWADTHSEEKKRGITIRLGYADANFYKCKKCDIYCNTPKCPKCFGNAEYLRTVSFVDLPGHETLMATVLSGASLMDAAILLISANEKCPQPQTMEHLICLEAVGIKNVVIVQNKIDLVSKEDAKKNYEQIKEFIKGTSIENAPIVPISAQKRINVDKLIEILQGLPESQKDEKSENLLIYTARSFDVNKPGIKIKNMKGGILGGTVLRGTLKKGDEIEIRPEINGKTITTKVIGIQQSGYDLEEGTPGGLVGIMTNLDPSICRSDGLSGYVLGKNLPPTWKQIKVDLNLIKRKMDVETNIKTNDSIMITSGVSKTVGVVKSERDSDIGKTVEFDLRIPICAEKGSIVTASKLINGRWYLVGYGKII